MIRKYKKSDTEEIVDVWYKSSSIAHPFLDSSFMEKEKTNIREIYLPNTKTWVFTSENSLDGFITMMDNEVAAIFVRPEKQGQGIGKNLMDLVSQIYDELEVEVFKDNKIGRSFYDNYGFKKINEHIHEESGHTLFRMKFIK